MHTVSCVCPGSDKNFEGFFAFNDSFYSVTEQFLIGDTHFLFIYLLLTFLFLTKKEKNVFFCY